jgi:hypothetical protein
MLAPSLGPGNIVVMDNLPAHKVGDDREMIETRGTRLLYLPPCSPDFNPIEQAFAKLKALLRKVAARTLKPLETAIADALDAFDPDECANSFTAAGHEPDRSETALGGPRPAGRGAGLWRRGEGRAVAFRHGLDVQGADPEAQHNLSDAQMEFMIRGRLSWLRFLGFDLVAPTPDENALRLYRDKLTVSGTLKRVMRAFDGSSGRRGTSRWLGKSWILFPPRDLQLDPADAGEVGFGRLLAMAAILMGARSPSSPEGRAEGQPG